jgi:hypothetical protein
MNAPSKSIRSAPMRARSKPSLAGWLWALAVLATAITVDQVLRLAEQPLGVRVLLALAPLVPGVFFFRAQSRALAAGDELALRINHEAVMFTFYALIGVFICTDLLENAGVLVGYTWNTLRLVVAMFLLMLIGTALSNRRYR